MLTFMKLLHLSGIVVWVGGMFFAYMVLRPVAAGVLQPPERLRLWNGVFARFFGWVWGAIIAILLSGLYTIYLYGGMAHVGHYVHVMLLLGLAMAAIFAYVFFGCYVPFTLHVDKERWKEAAAMLNRIRQLVAINLTLGFLTLAVARFGIHFG
jgi:uncharacterized membrane protein